MWRYRRSKGFFSEKNENDTTVDGCTSHSTFLQSKWLKFTTHAYVTEMDLSRTPCKNIAVLGIAARASVYVCKIEANISIHPLWEFRKQKVVGNHEVLVVSIALSFHFTNPADYFCVILHSMPDSVLDTDSKTIDVGACTIVNSSRRTNAFATSTVAARRSATCRRRIIRYNVFLHACDWIIRDHAHYCGFAVCMGKVSRVGTR